MHVARGVGAIQPFEGRIRIAQPGMHKGERIRRNVPLAGCHLQRPEQITRLGRAPGPPAYDDKACDSGFSGSNSRARRMNGSASAPTCL